MEDDLSLPYIKIKNLRSPYSQDYLTLIENRKTKVGKPATLVEKVLISKLKAGDHRAFSCIFTAYYQDLVMFAARFTHDQNNAEEIVQDTFVRLWEKHESVKITISLNSYLLKIVQNKCIDWYRHKRIMQTHNNVVMESSPQFECDTDSYILHSELQEQIEAALSKLPEEIAEAFRMNRNKGFKYHKIADIMGVSVRTVEVRIGKALHMLHNYLKEYFVFIITGSLSLYLSKFLAI
jgi:RNA polymerase sigma-70 factor (ECF subfamily)